MENKTKLMIEVDCEPTMCGGCQHVRDADRIGDDSECAIFDHRLESAGTDADGDSIGFARLQPCIAAEQMVVTVFDVGFEQAKKSILRTIRESGLFEIDASLKDRV
jgi:hypothetical protein